MINVYYVDDTYDKGFIVTGHAGYGSHGMDIVCAAVSAITQTALLGLQEHTSIEKIVREGYILVDVEKPKLETRVIIDTMVLGLKQIERQYPNHVQVWQKTDDSPGKIRILADGRDRDER